jgi:hypothetical protein
MSLKIDITQMDNPTSDTFHVQLFRLMAKADRVNYQRLKMAFPNAARVYETWKAQRSLPRVYEAWKAQRSLPNVEYDGPVRPKMNPKYMLGKVTARKYKVFEINNRSTVNLQTTNKGLIGRGVNKPFMEGKPVTEALYIEEALGALCDLYGYDDLPPICPNCNNYSHNTFCEYARETPPYSYW